MIPTPACILRLALHLALLAQPLAGPATTVANRWQVLGAGGGGALFHPTISPHDPDFALVGCDMTGTYVTHDGGQSWRMINLQQIARQFVFDPVDPNVVYARAGGLYKSADRGRTWVLLYPNPATVHSYSATGDHADITIVTNDLTRPRVTAFAVDPQDSTRLYATVRTLDEGGLYVSDDCGAHWLKTADCPAAALNVFIDPASPMADRTLYVTHAQGISIRQNGRWRTLGPPGGVGQVTSYAAGYDAAAQTLVIYAISGRSYFNPRDTTSGIFVTTDGGTTWTNVQDGLTASQPAGAPPPEWRSIATCGTAPSTVYVSYSRLAGPDGRTGFGVAQSEDYGRTWHLRWRDLSKASETAPASHTIDGWLDERFGPEWSENPFSIGVAPHHPLIVYATDFGRAVKTVDGGRTWQQVYTRQQEGGGWKSRGLDVTNVNSIVFDPFNPARAYLTATDIGLMRSDDGGESWSSATDGAGIPAQWQGNTYWLAMDPKVPGRMWAAMSGVHDLPREKMWRRRAPTAFNGGILRSDDSGKTWVAGRLEAGEAAVTHLLVDPASPEDNRTLYACAFGHGVLKSTDGGKHWVKKNHGITQSTPLAWRLYQRIKDRALFLILVRRGYDLLGGHETDGAIYRSDDGAESWHPLPLPAGANGPTSLSVESVADGTLLLSTWGRKSPDPIHSDAAGGIFVSQDDGHTWQAALESDPHVYEITYDDRSRTHYACGFNASAYLSTNNGRDWRRIAGYDFKWGKRVDIDPLNAGLVYISTYGGGVWHGPAVASPPASTDQLLPPAR